MGFKFHYYPKSKMKYRSKRVERAGYSFASQLESATFDLISILHRGKDIQVQKHVYLTRARILYIVDFVVLGTDGTPELYVEAKGFQTPEWRIKRRLWICYGPGTLEVYGGSHRKPVLTETIIPKLEAP